MGLLAAWGRRGEEMRRGGGLGKERRGEEEVLMSEV